MKVIRRVVVFDAKDIEAESTFWAGLLGGEVHRDDDWHSIVVDGDWVMGVQRALATRSASACTDAASVKGDGL